MRIRPHALALCLSIPLVPGCWLVPEGPAPEAEVLELPSQPLPLEGSPTAYGMLRVVNELDFPALDDEVGLARQAAASIIAHRAGPDERLGTPDDRYVEDLAQLDALYWLGEENLWVIQAFALLEGWVPEAVPMGCEPALGRALHECRDFVAQGLAGAGEAAVDASWSCVEAGDGGSPAAGFFAQTGIVGYRDPALGYHALLCGDGDDASICALGVAGFAEHALPECVAAEGGL